MAPSVLPRVEREGGRRPDVDDPRAPPRLVEAEVVDDVMERPPPLRCEVVDELSEPFDELRSPSGVVSPVVLPGLTGCSLI